MCIRACVRFGGAKWPLAISLLMWPWLVGWVAEGYIARAELAASRMGELYAQFTKRTRVAPKLPPPEEPEEPVGFTIEGQAPKEQATRGGRRRPKGGPAVSSAAKPTRGIRVRKSSILRLARARAIPDSAPVPAAGSRPAGLRLAGVSGLGVGMLDGDVITSVAGVPVSSKSEIVTQVLHARARKAETLSAVFFRGEKPWQLLVELPYPEPKAKGKGRGTSPQGKAAPAPKLAKKGHGAPKRLETTPHFGPRLVQRRHNR